MIRIAAPALAALVFAAPALAPGDLSAQQQPEVHTVQAGNTLWDLAQRFYGDPFEWRTIWEANRETIPNPDLILPGQTLRIPDGQGGFFEVRVVEGGGDPPPAAPPIVDDRPQIERTIFYPQEMSREAAYSQQRERQYVAVPEQSFWSAPFLVRTAPTPRGTFTSWAGAEEVRGDRVSAKPFDRLIFENAAVEVGGRYLLYRTEMREGLGEVAFPTGLVTITQAGVGEEPAIGLLDIVFGRSLPGDRIVELEDYDPRTGAIPTPIGGGLVAGVLGYARDRALQGPGDFVFLNVGDEDGVTEGDEFSVRWEDGGDETEGRVQIVRAGDGVSTARILTMRNAVFIDGIELVQSRRMPGN